MAAGINLKRTDIETAFGSEDLRRRFPPILSVPQVADLLGGLSPKTVYLWIAKHRFDGCFRRRGKHLLFWRDRVLEQVFNGPDWSD